jgi:hypothetical protein
VQTVTSNFASYTVRRLQRQKHQVYKSKEFQIQSLTSLVKIAKQKTSERLLRDDTDETVKLPIHDVTERVMESLQQMHLHLQNLLMQKLGSDARNVITAERARQASSVKRQEAKMREGKDGEEIVRHLSEIGQVHGADELELLNGYRERYAAIMAELLVAKERLLKLEIGLRDRASDEALRKTISEDIDELNDLNEGDFGRRGQWKRRSSEW